MKHSLKIVSLLLAMFLITQLIGLAVIYAYTPEIKELSDDSGNIKNITVSYLPYGTAPPADITPQISLISIIIALFFAVALMFILMKLRIEFILRLWFFIVVTLALAITINSAILGIKNASLIALIIALPFAYIKIFKRNILVHNLTELLIYPGIAAILVPILNIWATIVLLIFLSIYDVYAVWHAGFMQKMAKYQIQKLRLFAGFFVPYLRKEDMIALKKTKGKTKNVKVSVAILGGGDVVFPIILAGVVLYSMGIIQALIISVCATLALACLFYKSEKGKFYPALPFISAGCFIGLAIAYLI